MSTWKLFSLEHTGQALFSHDCISLIETRNFWGLDTQAVSRESSCSWVVQTNCFCGNSRLHGLYISLNKVQCPFRVLCHPDTCEQHMPIAPGPVFPRSVPRTLPKQHLSLFLWSLLTHPAAFSSLIMAAIAFYISTGVIICHLQVFPWTLSVLSPSWVSHRPPHSAVGELRARMDNGPFSLLSLHSQVCQVVLILRGRSPVLLSLAGLHLPAWQLAGKPCSSPRILWCSSCGRHSARTCFLMLGRWWEKV